jgi:hypothetical protein
MTTQPYFEELKSFVLDVSIPGMFDNPEVVAKLFECIEKQDFTDMKPIVDRRRKLIEDMCNDYRHRVLEESAAFEDHQRKKAQLVQSREQLQKETVSTLLKMCHSLSVHPRSKTKGDIIDALINC